MKVVEKIRAYAGSKVLAFVIVLILSCSAFALVPGSASSPTPSIVSEGNFNDIVVDDSRSVIYASEVSLGAVVVFDMLTDAMITTVLVGPEPHGLAMSADGLELFVAITGGHEIAIINLDSMTVSRHVSLSVSPWDVAVGVPGRLYVTAREDWSYPVIVDTVNGVVIATMTQGDVVLWGSLVKASPDGKFIYVAEMYMYPSFILKYSVAKDKVRFLGSSPWNMYGGGVDFAVGSDGYLYFSGGDYTIHVVDSSTWTIVKTVPDEVGCYKILLAQNGGILLGTSMDNGVIAVDISMGEVLMTSSFIQRAIAICSDKNGGILYGITNPYSYFEGRIEKIETGIPAPSLPEITGTMTVYGKSMKLVSMDFTPAAAGSWWAEVKDSGLAGVDLKFYDMSSGVPVKLLAQDIRFDGDRHATKYSSSVDVLYGGTYRMTAEASGRYAGSALVNGLFVNSGIVAEAGPIQYVPVPIPDMITLDGSASYSSCDIVSYVWTWVGGMDNTPKMVTGMNPSVPWQWFYYIENYTVTLTIADAEGNTATDTMNVYIAFRLNREDNAFGDQQWYANSDGYLKVMIDNHGMNWVDWTVMDCTTSPHIVYESTMYFSGDGVYVSEPFWMSAGQHVQVEYQLDGGPPGAYMFVYGFFVPVP